MTRWSNPNLTRFWLDPSKSDEELLAHIRSVAREAGIGLAGDETDEPDSEPGPPDPAAPEPDITG